MFKRIKRWLNKVTSPEGCTAVDARKLREYNHNLADEVHKFQITFAELSAAIHYPECWDTMVYPSLLDALIEIGCSAEHEDSHQSESQGTN